MIIALNLHAGTQALQRLHLFKSITACRQAGRPFFLLLSEEDKPLSADLSITLIASKGHAFTHKEHPVHFSIITWIGIS